MILERDFSLHVLSRNNNDALDKKRTGLCAHPGGLASIHRVCRTLRSRPRRLKLSPMQAPLLTIRAIRSIGVEVPMTYALGTSRGVITKGPLLLLALETEEGVTGRSYLWCYFPAAMPVIAKILEEVARVVEGERLAPADLWSKL